MYLSIIAYIFSFINIEDKIDTKDVDYFSAIALKCGILSFFFIYSSGSNRIGFRVEFK